MALIENWNRQIPDYYSTMYMDGYSPEQILMAKRKSIYEERTQEEFIPIKLCFEVKRK